MTNIWQEAFDSSDTGVFDPAKLDDEFIDKSSDAEEGSVSEDTVSLINLGKISHSFNLWGHTIVIRTLRINEELEIGQLVALYKDTEHEDRAYITATVAAAIESVDGDPLYMPLGPTSSLLRAKFDIVKENYYWPVVLEIFKEYGELIKRVAESLEEIKKN